MKQLILRSLMLSFLVNSIAYAEDKKEIYFGVAPWNKPEVMYQMHKPLIPYLTEQLGQKVIFYIATDYTDLTQQIKQQKIDVGIFPPNTYIQAKNDIPDLKYLATMQQKEDSGKLQPYYKGVIAVHKSSPIRSLQDLQGKRFGFTDPQSTSGYLFPYAFMTTQSINPETYFSEIFMLKKHDKVMAALANQSIDGGATGENQFLLGVKQHGDVFRIIADTGTIPHSAYAAGSHVQDVMCQAIQTALSKLIPDSTTIQNMKQQGFSGDGFAILDDHLYDDLRKVLQKALQKN